MRSSQAAVNLIVSSEVTSKEVFIAKYARPEWPPGGNSGITVGIGYDLGYQTADQILADWKDYLTPDIVRSMQSVAGLKGQAAHNALAGVRSSIYVGWDAAMAVFIHHDMPKWEALVVKAVPGSEQLPAGCFGVLTGIAYNRGASFSKPGDRYTEMRNIRMYVASGEWDRVPDEIRNMKRLWTKPSERGLIIRREAEAKLWEQSLGAFKPSANEDTTRVSSGDERDDTPFVTPAGNGSTPINVQPSTAVYSVDVETVQRALVSMNYHEVGDVDGKAGGKFVAGVAAFMTDRGKDPNKGQLTQALKDEISAAKGEGWSRPIAPERANATAKDIASKVPIVNQTWYQKLYGYVLGIPAAATAVFKWVFGDNAGDPSSYITSVKNFFGAIPSEYYFAAIAGIAAIIVVQAMKQQNTTVKAYQRGEIN